MQDFFELSRSYLLKNRNPNLKRWFGSIKCTFVSEIGAKLLAINLVSKYSFDFKDGIEYRIKDPELIVFPIELKEADGEVVGIRVGEVISSDSSEENHDAIIFANKSILSRYLNIDDFDASAIEKIAGIFQSEIKEILVRQITS